MMSLSFGFYFFQLLWPAMTLGCIPCSHKIILGRKCKEIMGGSGFDGGRVDEKLAKQSSRQRTCHQLQQLTCAHKGCCQKPIVSDKQSLQILCSAEIAQKKRVEGCFRASQSLQVILLAEKPAFIEVQTANNPMKYQWQCILLSFNGKTSC